MLQNMLTVGEQVLILFILIGMGFLAGKTRLFTDQHSTGLNNVVLYFVLPCVVLNSYQRDYDPSLLTGLLIALAAGIIAHAISIMLAHLLVHDPDKRREKVSRFAVAFSNAGFMAFPLQQALLGDIGVFYGVTYVIVFNILSWSYGVVLMADKGSLSVKKILLQPAILASIGGLILFFFSFRLPHIIAQPVSYIAALNTPIPMFLVGFFLSQADLGRVFRNKKNYLVVFIRLILSPLLALGTYLLLGIRGDVFIACMIGACAPVAAMSAMFAKKFDGDVETGVGLVSVTTILSVLTMPVIIGLAQLLA